MGKRMSYRDTRHSMMWANVQGGSIGSQVSEFRPPTCRTEA